MPAVQIVRGPQAGSVVELRDGETLVVGRRAAASPEEGVRQLVIDDRKVSRAHCRIRCEAGRWTVEDLGSANGTTVGGVPVRTRILAGGDSIRVGDSVLEWLEPGRLPDGATEPAPSLDVGVRAPEEASVPERPRARPGLRWGLAAALGASLAVAAVLVSRGAAPARVAVPSAPAKPPAREASPPAPDVRGRPEVSRPPPGESEAPRTPETPLPAAVPESPRDFIDPAAEVASLLERKDYKGAIGFLDAFIRDHPDAEVSGERSRVLEAATRELAGARDDVDRLVASGDTEGARELGMDLLLRVPEGMFEEASRMLRLVADAETVRMERERAAAEAPEKEMQERVEETLRLAAKTLSGAEAREESVEVLEALRGRISELLGTTGAERAVARRRVDLRAAYLDATERVLRAQRRRARFHAGRATWTGGDVVLSYAFESDDELLDFHLLDGAKAELRRERKGIVLAGECRLFEGEPFRDRILVRATIPASGYDPKAPSIGISLFGTRVDRLTTPSGRPRSLLAPGGARPGAPPSDNLVFLLGYHAVVAEYGGRGVEELTIEGVPEPVSLPAHVLLGVARGSLLHSDPREGMWAAPLSRPFRGALQVEAGFAGGTVSWSLGGKPVFGGPAPAFERLATESPRFGTVTLLAPRGAVRWERLEIEASVREDVLYAGVRKEALAAFEAIAKP